jgi:hypothetical protein
VPNVGTQAAGMKSISSEGALSKAQEDAEIARKQAEFIKKEAKHSSSTNNEDSEEIRQQE